MIAEFPTFLPIIDRLKKVTLITIVSVFSGDSDKTGVLLAYNVK